MTPVAALGRVLGSSPQRATLLFAMCTCGLALLLPAGARADAQHFNHSDGLSGSQTRTLQGTRSADGACTWSVPTLEGTNVEARQISADWSTCTSTIEIGTPQSASDGPDTSDGTAADVPAEIGDEPENPLCVPGDPYPVCVARAQTPTQTATTSTTADTGRGRYVVGWEDFIHIDVTKVRSHLTWTYDDSCVRSSSGRGSAWWRSGTGWSRVSMSARISYVGACSTAQRVWTDAFFENTAFCNNDVYNQYDNVTARGDRYGLLRGWVHATTASHCAGRPDLHLACAFDTRAMSDVGQLEGSSLADLARSCSRAEGPRLRRRA
jgi:hypothetical protein